MSITTTYQAISIGLAPNDGTGDNIRDSFDKVNASFTNLYTWAFGPSATPYGLKFIDLVDVPHTYSTGTAKVSNNPILIGINNAGNALTNRVVNVSPDITIEAVSDSSFNIRNTYPPSITATAYTTVLRDAFGNIQGGGIGTGTVYIQTTSSLSTASINFITNLVATSTSSLAQDILILNANFTNLATSVTNAASITYVNTVAANSTASIASTVQTLQSQYTLLSNTVTSAVVSFVNNATSNSTSSLASTVQTLQAQVNAINTGTNTGATITYVNQVAASSTASLASQLASLSSTVGTLTTTVTQFSSSINGLQGAWGVTVNNNGYVSGIKLISGGTTSSFIVNASNFIVTGTGLTSSITPFTIDTVNNTLKYGGSLSVGSNPGVKSDRSMTGTGALILPNGNFALGNVNNNITYTGSNITFYFNNGTYMKVQGTAFGSTNQFIEWYGPSQVNLNSCTEANAVFYLKTNGAAYFGGSLSAGTLTTKAGTSDISSTATAETSVFGSNGHQITVTLSYSFSAAYFATYAPNTTGQNQFNTAVTTYSATQNPTTGDYTASGTDPTGTYQITLYRSINGGAYTAVAVLNLGGTWSVDLVSPSIPDVAPGSGNFNDSSGGSLTYSDPQLIAQNRQFKAVLSRGTTKFNTNIVQNVSIICVEQ